MALIDVYNPAWWADFTLTALFEKTAITNMVTKDFSTLIANSGDTINTRIPGKFTIGDMSAGSFSAQDPDATNVQIKLDKWRGNAFQIDDKTKSMSMADLLEIYALPQAESFKKDVEQAIFAQYVYVSENIGGAGTTPSGVDKLGTDVKQKFDEMLLPEDGRNVILSPAAENKWHQAFYNTFVQAPGVLLSGQLGKRFGIDYFGSTLIPSHATGTTTAGTLSANATIGDTSIGITGATGNVKIGDLFKVGAYTYSSTANVNLTGGAATVPINTPIKATVASGQTVTATAAHVVNLGFHKQAFALVNRAPEVVPDLEIGRVSVVELNGFSVRAQVWRDPKDKRTYVQMDTMYGVKTLDPNKAFRILG